MKRKKIAFDLDGVLANFTLGFTSLAHEMDSQLPIVNDGEEKAWEYSTWYCNKETENRIWKYMRDTMPLFWLTLNSLVSPKEMERIFYNQHEVYIITSRPEIGPISTQKQSVAWIQEFMVGRPPQVICHSDKKAVCNLLSIDYYIDDRLSNIQPFFNLPYRSITKAYLLHKPYMKEEKYMVESVSEFLDIAGL